MKATMQLRRLFSICVGLVVVLSLLPFQPAAAVSPDLVISQLYGGGGNANAQYQNDFIELFNRGTATVSLTGWSVQYTSATGTGNFGSASNLITPLSGSLAPGQYLLIAEAAGTSCSGSPCGSPLPTPDVTDSTPINMSAGGGKVALVNTAAPLGCNGSSAPCSPAALAQIVDLVGWDGANFFEGGGPGPTASNILAVFRAFGGCQDTDDNSSDFALAAPAPRNTASPLHVCGGDAAPFVQSTVPANSALEVPLNGTIDITFSEPVSVTGGWFSLSCLASGAHTAAVSGGPATFTLTPDALFIAGEPCTLTVYAAGVTDQDLADPPDNMSADFTTSFTTVPQFFRIHDIQGAGHISPKNGLMVVTEGIVTALRTAGSTRGFYLQDQPADYDADPATSEGVFVFTGGSSNPASLAAVGDLVEITAKVSEYRATAAALTLTELGAPFTINKISSSNQLPAPVVLGAGGLIPPSTVIEDDASGSVETTGVFDPANDGIDFYESMEGMLVQVNNAVAVGPISSFTSNHEIPVVGDDGANAGVRTSRGGVLAQAGDFNPERIILNDWISGGPILPPANVGDRFPGATLGVVDYSFNNFKLQVISMPALVSGGLSQETAPAAGLNQVSAAAFNVENLAPTDPPGKFSTLADLIVAHLHSPDILSIEEVQDNSGTTNNGVVEASTTWNMIVAAIQAAGGPAYAYRQIDPVNNEDGGATGGNIRVGFLFRTDRGLSFIDRPGAASTTANAVVGSGASTQLLYSPGRIDPTNAAFADSRKPLAGEFMFNGHHLFVIANHWNSKGGDEPLFGVDQPPVFSSEVQRNQQAAVVHSFVSDILTADPNANVLVMGDLNDFQFSSALGTLKGSPAILNDLIETLPLPERYTYVYEGNSETLDHILASAAVMARPFVYDVVHVNSEFAVQVSDHEPQAMVITFNDPPAVSAGGPYTVNEGSSVTLTATGTDPENGPLTYAWDLDNNGTFETAGQSVSFAALDGPSDHTVTVKVTDDGGLTAKAQANVHVNNLPPVVSTPVVSPEPSTEGSSAVASASYTDPAADLDMPFSCSVDYGDGSAAQPGAVSDYTCTGPAHTYSTFGLYTVTVSVTDKDGGVGSNVATHAVIFNWTGFFPPVENLPMLNAVIAGRAVPVKFSLGGDKGSDIIAPDYPISTQFECSSSAPQDDLLQTVTAGSSSLTYDPFTGQYTYVWKTDKSWAGTCRQLIVMLVDGTTHVANFIFK